VWVFFVLFLSATISLLTDMAKPPIKSKLIHSALSFDYIPCILILIKICGVAFFTL